jgi:hypothetical protein
VRRAAPIPRPAAAALACAAAVGAALGLFGPGAAGAGGDEAAAGAALGSPAPKAAGAGGDEAAAGAALGSRAPSDARVRSGDAAGAAPRVRQLIVFRDGSAVSKTVSTRATRVRVEGRRCTAGDGTPLAALVRSRPGRLRLLDFASCSRRARDGGGLFVKAIRSDVNRRTDGWVYQVGRRAATAGAADPGGPLGRGRLREGQRVTWFYCRMRRAGCQRTLELAWRVEPGTLVATVRGYDDEARGVAVEGATVSAGGGSALTDSRGEARLPLPAGRSRAVAEKPGLVRSFAERVEVP